MHKHTRHVGKAPRRFPDPNDRLSASSPVSATETNPRARLSELRQALSKSVEDEDYEEAARLRDAISRLEALIGDA
jgi:protein-arginine kinase activator protein McsA